MDINYVNKKRLKKIFKICLYDFTGEVPLKNHIGNIYNKEGIKDIN